MDGTMTQEEKQLLLCDLCSRLPYKVKVVDDMGRVCTLTLGNVDLCSMFYGEDFDQGNTPSFCKPYLRPMFSMTEEEKDEYHLIQSDIWKPCGTQYYDNWHSIDWLNAHHFDFRNLIEKGLALVATEGMYNNKEEQQ